MSKGISFAVIVQGTGSSGERYYRLRSLKEDSPSLLDYYTMVRELGKPSRKFLLGVKSKDLALVILSDLTSQCDSEVLTLESSSGQPTRDCWMEKAVISRTQQTRILKPSDRATLPSLKGTKRNQNTSI